MGVKVYLCAQTGFVRVCGCLKVRVGTWMGHRKSKSRKGDGNPQVRPTSFGNNNINHELDLGRSQG